MSYKLGFRRLKNDIFENKQIALFLGAGVNCSEEIKLMWSQLLNPILKSAFYRFSAENGLSRIQLNSLLDLFEIQEYQEFQQEKGFHDLREKTIFEYGPTVRAMIVKTILGRQYIPAFQEHIYTQCNRTILRNGFRDYALVNKEEYKKSGILYTLYTVARFILLNKNVKAVVTYNYDNFLTHAINILQSEPEKYFCKRDIEDSNSRLSLDKKQRLKVQDIYGKAKPDYLDSDTIFIYHPHGYIPSPMEGGDLDLHNIIMSQDEYCEDTSNVYSWHNDTQVHLLSHYTCLFFGSSISELSTQRMIHYAKKNGNSNSLYYLSALTNNTWQNSPISNEANEALSLLKVKYYETCGLVPVICSKGFNSLLNDFNEMTEEWIVESQKKNKDGKN